MGDDIILAIDQGTTGTTCLLVDETLNIIGRHNEPFAQHFPRPGWVEHDPHEIWDSVCRAVERVFLDSGTSPTRVAAIGITNQRETTLVWDPTTGAPVHGAIVWQDRRTADRCLALRRDGREQLVAKRTGLVLDPYFSGTKIAWILDHVEGARARAEGGSLIAGTVDTYLLWRLTGGVVHATEPSNASRTMLWPLVGGGWDADLCDLLGVPMGMLPRVQPCAGSFGTTRGVPGLPDGIPVSGMVGDQQSATFAQACFTPGDLKCTYGTGAFIMMNIGTAPRASDNGLLTTVGWQLKEETIYCLEGSAFMAGAVVQWLRDGLGFIETAAEIEALAASVPDSGGVILVPGHAGLGAPHWRPEAKGGILGLTRGTTRAHIARAALDGIALQIADLLVAMEADGGVPLSRIRVDGGAAANNLLMQIQSDVLGRPLERSANLEMTALGAVFMAGLGVGLWSDTAELARVWKGDAEFTPGPGADQLGDLKERWKRAVSVC